MINKSKWVKESSTKSQEVLNRKLMKNWNRKDCRNSCISKSITNEQITGCGVNTINFRIKCEYCTCNATWWPVRILLITSLLPWNYHLFVTCIDLSIIDAYAIMFSICHCKSNCCCFIESKLVSETFSWVSWQ